MSPAWTGWAPSPQWQSFVLTCTPKPDPVNADLMWFKQGISAKVRGGPALEEGLLSFGTLSRLALTPENRRPSCGDCATAAHARVPDPMSYRGRPLQGSEVEIDSQMSPKYHVASDVGEHGA